MANKDDYLTVYREFFENFAKTVNPHDQLPVKLGSYKVVNLEVVGEIIDWTTQYLSQKFWKAVTLFITRAKMNWVEWNPDEGILSSIKEVLQEALMPNNEIQRNVQEKINVMQNVPDYTFYLLFILGNPTFSEDVRSLSGVLLKTNILTICEALPKGTILKIGQECLRLLRDPSRDVRTSSSNVVVNIAKDNLSEWPEVIEYLMKSFDQSGDSTDVALNTLFHICEELIIGQKSSQEIFSVTKDVFPKLIEYLGDDKCKESREIIKTTNTLLQDYYVIMSQSIDLCQYLRNVMQLADTEDIELQKHVCHTFVIYMQNRHESLLPHLTDVIIYLLGKTQHKDKEVALQACEFWLATTKLNNCRDILSLYVDKLIPILLKNMKYSDYELNALKHSLGNDAQVEDMQKDIYPFHMRDKNEEDYYYSSDEENECEDGDMDDYYVGWTLRKCSAASLDSIASRFGDAILPLLIPFLNEILNHSDYLIKESAILALGAIAEGCMNGLKPHLPCLVDFLIKSMTDEHSMVRVIICWTLSRYANWIVNVENSDHIYFIPVMTILLKHFVDENKRVQRAAISAFCIFQEEAQMRLVPYVDFILDGFQLGFQQFQYRSLYLLYDAIGVLAQSIGNHLSKQEYVNKLMPPLMRKIALCGNYYDDHFVAILECLANLIPSLEVSFLPYAEVIYCHCLQIINDTLVSAVNYRDNPHEYDPPDKELMNVAIDVLYSMALGLKTHFIKFVTNSNLVFLLHSTMQDDSFLIRQTSVVLYGELITLCYPYLATNISEYIPIIVRNLNENFDGVCNNAAWVVGKLCSIMGNNIQPYLSDILMAFLRILKNPVINRPMYQTVAVSMCTILYVCPDISLPDLDVLLKNCCLAIRHVRDSEEKELAFRGLCAMVIRHPEFAKNNFIYFCDAVASFNNVRIDLKDTIRNIFITFKDQVGNEEWCGFYSQFPEALKARLTLLYGV